MHVEIPYAPRIWAKKLHASFKRWSALVLHRRAGKTTAVLNHHQRAAIDDDWERRRLKALLPKASEEFLAPLLNRRVYWHVMPTLKQAKLVAWDILKEISRPIPGVKVNNSELCVTYPTGSKIHLIGADNPDSLRGPALSGLSLDEYSQIAGNVFGEILSKALGDHLGYGIFAGTIRGKDQLFDIYEAAREDAEWYAVWQDIDESLRTEMGPTITALERALEDDRKLVLAGVMLQSEFDQEWHLSPDAAVKGAWYGRELAQAKEAGRICAVPYDPALPVDTDWDLGIDDSTAIWFSQSTRSGEVRLIDYYEASGEGFPHYIRVLADRGYIYGKHHPPHDIAVRELGTGKSRHEIAASLGLKFQAPSVNPGLYEGIDATRLFMARCWWDAKKCAAGLEALRHYRKRLNTRLQEFTGTPVHDWSSHGADAFRGLAVRHRVPVERRKPTIGAGAAAWAWS